MRAFAALYDALDTTTSTNARVQALVAYFRAAPPADAAWAVWFLSGRRLKRFIGPALLRRWLVEIGGEPEWLVEEAYASVGDLAETIALLLDRRDDGADQDDVALTEWVEHRLLPLRGLPPEVQREQVLAWWHRLPWRECFLLNKLLTGELRVGVSQTLVARALAEVANLPRPAIEHRLMGDWSPSPEFYARLVDPEQRAEHDGSRPYPFFLASPLEHPPEQLGDVRDWQAEWKWDGIRAQLVKRGGQVYLWSRGEELVTERFPELAAAAARLPDGLALDGEVLAWHADEGVLPFGVLQTRIGRTKLSKKLLESAPVRFLAYDLLEQDGRDLRSLAIAERRARLDSLRPALPLPLIVGDLVAADSWTELARLREGSRERRVEGLMLKAKSSVYGTGRTRGAWWKWKIEPFTFDGVLVYAQPGHGRRSSLYTDYTFAVWRGTGLVPVAKAYSGLTDAEILEVDRWIRRHTVERFGPVRSVEPVQVFELAFEGINRSTRHKSGIALRFPRIARWRHDKPASEADTLANLEALIGDGTPS
ncbi:MAG: ATP-dependent DNA ligase [Steroidobacteraceae bacterium]|nr:ATP-dependent DNA ligase [Steroidobacteraceae bacterium]